MRFFNRQGQKQSEDKHIRGFQLAQPEEIIKNLIKRAKVNKKRGVGDGSISNFKIDDHVLTKQDFEVQYLLIDGTTGAGKSVMIRKLKLLRWIRKRGDKVIIYDKGCTFVSKFYNPDANVIFNPFDERCAHWNIWCDAKDVPDFENMAAALIPQHREGDLFWVDSAHTTNDRYLSEATALTLRSDIKRALATITQEQNRHSQKSGQFCPEPPLRARSRL